MMDVPRGVHDDDRFSGHRVPENPAGRLGNLPLQTLNSAYEKLENHAKICTAVEIYFVHSAPIVAPQCKFIWTAVRFLAFFGVVQKPLRRVIRTSASDIWI